MICKLQAKKGALLIDSSTVDPGVAREISVEAKLKGLSLVDAPVSGGKKNGSFFKKIAFYNK